MEKIKKYHRVDPNSYTLGSFPTYELLESKPELVKKVIYSPEYEGTEKLLAFTKKLGVPCFEEPQSIRRISDKGNVYVAALFQKPEREALKSDTHVLLVNPSDMGNLGTIIRTAAGMGGCDIAMISPCADLYDPRTVRASMGALFRIRTAVYPSLEEYRKCYSEYALYPFMLKGSVELGKLAEAKKKRTLVFGNEATGLPDEYAAYGQSVRIPMSSLVDSYNLAISVGIGLYAFNNMK
ncbi:MAG: TrmH family RNA methyltransferase [Clostridia bacterium]|nr:TrmH family RNA methyltransferase [Clostridia bacterium]